jgi:hypothetical protein
MDETAYKSARGELNRLPCVFEKALLSRCVGCGLAVRHLLAERETVACADAPARAACAELSELLREKSAFALRVRETMRILPHAMVMKIQCGGLHGLRDALDPAAGEVDVASLVARARRDFGAVAALPFSQIVQGVAHWQGRKRHGPKGSPGDNGP